METNVESMLLLFSSIRKAYAKKCYMELKQYNFSPNEIDILIFLSNNKTIDTSKELAIYLNISKTLVCRSIDSLYQREFIEIQNDKYDKRIRHLLLTPNSQDVVKHIQKQKESFALSILQDITKEDMRYMMRTMDRIHQNIIKFTEEDEDYEGK